MELCDWRGRSLVLASHLAYGTSRKLANRQVNDEAKLEFPRHVAGFAWNRRGIGAAVSAELSAITRRAVRSPRAKALAKALRARLRRRWFATPELSAEDAHE